MLSAPSLYRLHTDQSWAASGEARLGCTADLMRIGVTVGGILRKYIDKYYRGCRERFHTEHAEYDTLAEDDPVFQDYRVTIARKDRELLQKIEALIKEGDRLYTTDCGELPTLHFDRHLYQPLLRNGALTRQPPGLEPSEVLFVHELKAYVRQEADGLLKGKELFLLRNLSRGKGIGFFEHHGFFPDFILWIKAADAQRLVFVEPHGVEHAKAADMDDRVSLSEKLRKLSADYGRKRPTGPHLSLDAFVLAHSKNFHELRDRYGAEYSESRLRAKHIPPFTKARAAEAVRQVFDLG